MTFMSLHHRRLIAPVLGIASILLLTAASARAAEFTDPAGDFIASYTGPQTSDLDVINANVIFTGQSFTFTSTQAGAIGQTPTGIYVWGIDRGAGTAGFPGIAPGVLFDSVFLINPAGGSMVRDNISGVSTPITDITVSGSVVSGNVPLSALVSRGFAPEAYQVNLWPRSGAGGNAAISDFAPDNSVAAVTNATPEPGTLSLLTAVSAACMLYLRRRRQAE